MSKKTTTMTHTGVVRGQDARRAGFSQRVGLRELSKWWVTKRGLKFKKGAGYGMGDWPMYHLDVDTIRPIKSKE